MPRAPHRRGTPDAPAPAIRSATIHDVARLAEVSLITVSRALNAPGRLAPETLARVQAAVSQVGYVPNLMAGGLRSSRTRMVAALVPTLVGQVFAEMIESLTTALGNHGYQVLVGQMGYENSREDQLLRAIIGRRPDAIVITGIMHSPESRRLLATSGIPVVETWDYTPTPVDMLVGLSHESLGYEVCRFLHARGRQQLATIVGGDERAVRRKNGFVAAARSFGLPTPKVQVVPAPTTHTHGRAAMQALLALPDRTEAVFCSSDALAQGVLTEARVRGIDVPRDLAVVGFGDLEFAASVSPALTTVRIDGDRMGVCAAQMIVDRIEGRAIAERIVDMGFSIVERETA